MSVRITNNSGATVYYLERKQTGWGPDVYQWGSDVDYSWSAWTASTLANGAQKWFSGDRNGVIFHTANISVANLAQGDAFSANVALWKSGLQDGSTYHWDTGNGTSHNGGSDTWLGYKGSYDSPVDLSVPAGCTDIQPDPKARSSLHAVASNGDFDYNKNIQFEWDNTSGDVCIEVAPLRVLFGGAPSIRGQSSSDGSFYKTTSGGTSHSTVKNGGSL